MGTKKGTKPVQVNLPPPPRPKPPIAGSTGFFGRDQKRAARATERAKLPMPPIGPPHHQAARPAMPGGRSRPGRGSLPASARGGTQGPGRGGLSRLPAPPPARPVRPPRSPRSPVATLTPEMRAAMVKNNVRCRREVAGLDRKIGLGPNIQGLANMAKGTPVTAYYALRGALGPKGGDAMLEAIYGRPALDALRQGRGDEARILAQARDRPRRPRSRRDE